MLDILDRDVAPSYPRVQLGDERLERSRALDASAHGVVQLRLGGERPDQRPAWTGRGRPPEGHPTRGDALLKAQAFAAEHAEDTPDARRTFRAALAAFLRHGEEERGLRGSTLHEYRAIGERLAQRPWRSLMWADRPLDTFAPGDLTSVRRELIGNSRSPDTLNHYRRVLRGVFGTAPSSPAHAWPWSGHKAESEGKLRFYSPVQVRRLVAEAYNDVDRAVFTLATEAGPRMSEIRALKVGNVDFAIGVLRFEDGFTTNGGHAGNKGRRVRSVPMTSNVRRSLGPFCDGRQPDELLFEHAEKPGEPLCGTSLYRRYVSAAKGARAPRSAISRPAPLLRNAGYPGLQYLGGPAHDGPPPHHDDGAVPALRA